MAALPDDIVNLNPTTWKEHLIVINAKLDNLIESQIEDREMYANYMEKTNEWIKCHEARHADENRGVATRTEKIDQLERRVNGWNLINSLGVIIAAILAALGLKGS